MRPSDLFWWIPSGFSSAAMASKEEWFAALAIVMAGSLMSLVVWDVRRADGFAAWMLGVLPAVEAVDKFLDERSKRRAAKRLRRLRARQRRRQVRHDARASRKRGA